MSNCYLCDMCANRNHPAYDQGGMVICKVFPGLVSRTTAVDLGRRYVYVGESGIEYDEPRQACEYYEPRRDG